jgi:hypothetical protein
MIHHLEEHLPHISNPQLGPARQMRLQSVAQANAQSMKCHNTHPRKYNHPVMATKTATKYPYPIKRGYLIEVGSSPGWRNFCS